ncbi:LysM peptidoglycan-binding domain-containing protein [Chlamydia sp. 17-3921]|uniref:LysM peptidoglycan-binding domain-containing protein n=1 Tax=Chlamydia sp. 17-3921 TaxID=2675798 RepID=UPI001919F0AF|nr:LysM peptidoglycan-binding domain-containing protein [Chlamydia sp. 17-3921]
MLVKHKLSLFFWVLCFSWYGILYASVKSPSLHAILAEVEDASAKLLSYETELFMLAERLDEQDSRLQKLFSSKPETLVQRIQQLEKDQKTLTKTLSVLTTSIKDIQTSIQERLQEVQKDYKLLHQDLKFLRRSLQALVDSSSPGAYPDFSDPTPKNIHIVTPGDSLSSIANKYKTTVQELKKTNKLNSDLIYAGQKLCLPTNKQ